MCYLAFVLDDHIYGVPVADIPGTPTASPFYAALQELRPHLSHDLFFLSEATTALSEQGTSWQDRMIDWERAIAEIAQHYERGALPKAFKGQLSKFAIAVVLASVSDHLTVHFTDGTTRYSAAELTEMRNEIRAGHC